MVFNFYLLYLKYSIYFIEKHLISAWQQVKFRVLMQKNEHCEIKCHLLISHSLSCFFFGCFFAGESGCLSLTTTTSAVAAAAAAASSSLPTGTPPTVLALADTTADGILH